MTNYESQLLRINRTFIVRRRIGQIGIRRICSILLLLKKP